MEITIKGKVFEYEDITLKKGTELNKILIKVKGNLLSDKSVWYKIVNLAFKKTGLWRIGIIPKQLRFANITVKDSGRIQADFFTLFLEAQKEQGELLKIFQGTKTQSTE